MAVLAHVGPAVTPENVLTAWNLDPVVVASLFVAAWAYRRGSARPRKAHARRAWYFAAALVAVAVALVSPLEALSEALASAHMVQHVLLVVVAAPLVAAAAPSATLARGTPRAVVRGVARLRARLAIRRLTWLRDPTAAWVLHVGTLWAWHAAVLYDAAVENTLLHAVEHATLFFTALLFWRAVIGPVGGQLAGGLGMLLVFAAALQSVFLSALLTFSTRPWYDVYATTTAAWGLGRLADQHLAGVIMWVPAGFVYVGLGLAMLASWIRGSEASAVTAPAR